MAAIERAITDGPEVERIIHMKTLHLGPEELLVAAKIAVPAVRDAPTELAEGINAVEARIRAAVPIARVIYLEPDIYRPRDRTGADRPRPSRELQGPAGADVEPLHGPIRDYAWGSRTAIAELQGRPVPSAGPEAELWLGAHPGARPRSARCRRRSAWPTRSPPIRSTGSARTWSTGSARGCRSC